MLRDENTQLKITDRERSHIEDQLVEAKIRSANLDLENDQLAIKVQQKSEQIKHYSERVTALEVELLRTKQELGEALNSVYEYEQTTRDREFFGGSVTLGGSGGQHNDSGNEYTNSEGDTQRVAHASNGGSDGGSGSTIKKESKKDKIKNFFKKHTGSGNQKQ